MSAPDFDPQEGRPRWVGLAAVVLLHVLIGWALLSGLARKAVEIVRKPAVEVAIVDEVKPPPPAPPKVPPPPPPPPKEPLPPPPPPPKAPPPPPPPKTPPPAPAPPKVVKMVDRPPPPAPAPAPAPPPPKDYTPPPEITPPAPAPPAPAIQATPAEPPPKQTEIKPAPAPAPTPAPAPAAPVAPPPPPAPPPAPAAPAQVEAGVACPGYKEILNNALADAYNRFGVEGVVVVRMKIRGGQILEVTPVSGPREYYRLVSAAARKLKCQTGSSEEVETPLEVFIRE